MTGARSRFILKIFFIAGACLALAAARPAPAQAGGWWQTNSTDSVGSGFWETQDYNAGYNSPHGGFSSSSNLCKTCHAVHMAGENSYRMLKSGNTTETRTQGEMTTQGMGNSRSTECMYCHDATSGATDRKPYELSPLGHTVRGEHTLGVTAIPDSDVNNPSQSTGIFGRSDPVTGQGAVLQCWQCHSVHGADTIGTTNAVEGNIYNGSDSVENWNRKILRLDPAGDGSVLAKGSGGLSASVWQGELDTDGAAVRTGFCADCHNQNPNWEMDSDDTTRPNGRSHPQGPGTDSQMEVYGTTKTVAAHPLERLGCRGCHYATVGAAGTGASRFPHQSVGWKLLFDEATMTGGSTDPLVLAGDPQRIIPKMDTICLSCHSIFEDLDDGTTEEVDCLNCHDSKYGAPDIGDELRKDTSGSAHPIRLYAGRHNDAETAAGLAAGNRHAECADCHSAKDAFPWLDSPFKGVFGTDVIAESTNTTPSLALIQTISYEWQLCFKCHSSFTGQPNSNLYESTDTPGMTAFTPARQGDKAFEFNTKNSAYHPVRATGRNQSANLNAQLATAGLSTSSTIKCTDCHNSAETSSTRGPVVNSPFRPKGTHGTVNNSRLNVPNSLELRAMYWTGYRRQATWEDAEWSGPDTGLQTQAVVWLCFLCHEYRKLAQTKWWGNGARTNFYQGININATTASPDGTLQGSLHEWHFVDQTKKGRQITCRNCHYNVHSNQSALNTIYRHNMSGSFVDAATPPSGLKTHLINFSPDVQPVVGESKPVWQIDVTNGERKCLMICHGANMTNAPKFQYEPPEGDEPSFTF